MELWGCIFKFSNNSIHFSNFTQRCIQNMMLWYLKLWCRKHIAG